MVRMWLKMSNWFNFGDYKQLEKRMATLEEQVQEIKTVAEEERAQVVAALKALEDQITVLQGQVNSGSALTPAALDSIKDSIRGVYEPLTVPINPV